MALLLISALGLFFEPSGLFLPYTYAHYKVTYHNECDVSLFKKIYYFIINNEYYLQKVKSVLHGVPLLGMGATPVLPGATRCYKFSFGATPVLP